MLVFITADHVEDAIHQLTLLCVRGIASSALDPEDCADVYCEVYQRIRGKLLSQIATDRQILTGTAAGLDLAQ